MRMQPTEVRSSGVRILHMLPDLALGGGQQVLLRNLKALKGAYQSHVCFLGPNRDMEPLFVAGGISLHDLHHSRVWTWPVVLVRLIHLVRKERIDLIHIQAV